MVLVLLKTTMASASGITAAGKRTFQPSTTLISKSLVTGMVENKSEANPIKHKSRRRKRTPAIVKAIVNPNGNKKNGSIL